MFGYLTKARKRKVDNIYTAIGRGRGEYIRRTALDYPSISESVYKKNPVAFACLEQIARSCSMVHLAVSKKNAKGEVEVIENHDLQKLLQAPNNYYGYEEFIKRSVIYYYLGGEAPFEIQKYSFGYSMIVVNPYFIQYSITGDAYQPYDCIKYLYNTNKTIVPEEFHIWKSFDPNDYLDGLGRGFPKVEPILYLIDQFNGTKEWFISILENGGSLDGVFSLDETLDQEEFELAKKSVKTQYQGAKNVGGYLVLNGSAKFQATQQTGREMDFIEGEKNVIQQICIGCGVDPILIGHNEFSSYNNKKEAEPQFYKEIVLPLMKDLASSLTMRFRNLNYLQSDEHISCITDHIEALQPDKMKLEERLMKADGMTINEKRKARGQEPVKGGDIITGQGFTIVDGQTYIPLNMISLSEANAPVIEEGKKSLNFTL